MQFSSFLRNFFVYFFPVGIRGGNRRGFVPNLTIKERGKGLCLCGYSVSLGQTGSEVESSPKLWEPNVPPCLPVVHELVDFCFCGLNPSKLCLYG